MSVYICIVFIILALMGIPLVASLLFSSIIIIFLVGNFTLLKALPLMLLNSVDSFTFSVVPLFILAGKLMSAGGICQIIFDFANSIVGWTRGGLGAVNVVASMIFGGMSGSSVADAAGLGPIEIEAMTKFGYPKEYAAALSLASSILSVVIPPSLLTVIYAIVAEVSVGSTLIAGLLPGILITLILILTNYFIARKYKYGFYQAFNIKDVYKSGKKSFFALLTPIILLGGLFGGVFTATEAAAITVFYVIIISLFVYKTTAFRNIVSILIDTAKDSTIALATIAAATFFVFLLSMERFPDKLAGSIISIGGSQPWLILIMITVVLLISGMFMSASLGIIVFTPIFLPLAKSIGIDPVHFGIIMVTCLAIGLITPPVGSCLYIICGVVKLPIEKLSVSLMPFYFVLYIALLIIIFVPQLSLFLPNLIWGP